MGRVLTEARIESLRDAWDVERGVMPADQARKITVTDALVDTGATALALPTSLIRQLGLTKRYEKQTRSAQGVFSMSVYDAVHLFVGDRDCVVEVMEVPDGTPVLIGQIPLEWMDYVVDARNQKLIGNPAHGGEWVLDMF